jgi:hypothetical protein
MVGSHHLVIGVRKPTRLAFGRHGGLVASAVHSGKPGAAWLELSRG